MPDFRQSQILGGFPMGQQSQPQVGSEQNQGRQPQPGIGPQQSRDVLEPAHQPQFGDYLNDQLGNIRKFANTLSNNTFADSTRLDALNRFIADFGEIFGGGKEPISQGVFKANKQAVAEAAKKVMGQLDLVDQGKLGQNEFFSAAQDVFDDVMDDLYQDEFSPSETIMRDEPPQEGDRQGLGPPVNKDFETITLPDGTKYAVPKGQMIRLGEDGVPQVGKWNESKLPQTPTQKGTVTDFSPLWNQ